ncbi:hypothetical protein SASPL_127913 [Salvia splendens]|uniref:Protein kinase domain-containing protein n=1 Tax=Salvia splendens TaxID=180675 RepID=A0A8X8ZM92_SALSN|nr:hypothetical protein SASPL_127913 [Salvia splendens]
MNPPLMSIGWRRFSHKQEKGFLVWEKKWRYTRYGDRGYNSWYLDGGLRDGQQPGRGRRGGRGQLDLCWDPPGYMQARTRAGGFDQSQERPSTCWDPPQRPKPVMKERLQLHRPLSLAVARAHALELADTHVDRTRQPPSSTTSHRPWQNREGRGQVGSAPVQQASQHPRFTNVESSSIYGQLHFTNRDSSYVPPRQYKTSTIRQPTYSSDVPPRNPPEMDRLKLFDSDGISSDDDLSKIEINQEFAKNKKREELHRYEALKKQGRVDSSASDSEESSSGEEELKKPSKKTDANFFEVLIKVKNQDPILREQDAKLFESDDEDSDEEEDTASMKKGKPMYLKDVVSKQLIKAGPELSDEEDGSGDGGENNKLKSYSHEQKELRKQINRPRVSRPERIGGMMVSGIHGPKPVMKERLQLHRPLSLAVARAHALELADTHVDRTRQPPSSTTSHRPWQNREGRGQVGSAPVQQASQHPRFTNVESSSIYGQLHFTNRDSSYVPPRQYKTSTIRQPTYSSDVPPRNPPEMDRLKLFDSDGISSDDDLSKIEINQEFAKNKKREELHRYEALKKQGRVDSSASDSEESSSGEEELKKPSKKTDANFFEVLIKVKNQDPILREQDAKLFESDDEDSDEEEDTASMKKGKPMYLKDVVSKQLIKAGPELSDEEDGSGDGGENNKLKSYSHEQKELRKQIGRIRFAIWGEFDLGEEMEVGCGDSSHKGSAYLSEGTSSSLTNPNSSSNSAAIYTTARVFTSASRYSFNIKNLGTHLVRLHFSPFTSPNYDLKNGKFGVSSNGISLLTSFSANATVVKEFFVMVDRDELEIVFTPDSSFAFVSAIEVFSAPKDFFIDAGGIALISPGEISEFKQNVSNQVLETVHRVNVGGLLITPFNDTLWRSWIPDEDFLAIKSAAKVARTSDPPDYQQGGATREVAPDNVYMTAQQMNVYNGSLANHFNITWDFPVGSEGAMHLVRLHFCDIVSVALNTLYFNIYINGVTAYKDVDLYVLSLHILASPYYIDFVVKNMRGSGVVRISVGPSDMNNAMKKNAILNGVEIMRMLNYVAPSPLRSKKDGKWIVLGCVVGGVLVLILAVVMVLAILGCRKRKPKPKTRRAESAGWTSLRVFGGGSSHATISQGTVLATPSPYGLYDLKILFADLQLATDNFDKSLVVGTVYKGVLKDSVKVAVKRGVPGSRQGLPEFHTEITVLSKIRHHHLVSLVGYCEEQSEMILVYEYMEKGPLRNHLYVVRSSQVPSRNLGRRLRSVGAEYGVDRPTMGDVVWNLEYAYQLQTNDRPREEEQRATDGNGGDGEAPVVVPSRR